MELVEPRQEVIFQAANGVKHTVKIASGNYQRVSRIAQKPTFDGSGAWVNNLPKATVGYPDNIAPASALQPELCYFKTSFNPTGHNVSADYWVACDNENFYLGIKVDDPKHVQRHNGSSIWQDDSIQFVFGFGNVAPSALYYPVPAPRTAFNYGAALTEKGPIIVKYRGKDGGKKDLPINITRKNNITFYEICIPFKELGGKPDRFGFVVFDNNNPALRRAPYWLEHSGGIAGGEDESQLKHLLYQ